MAKIWAETILNIAEMLQLKLPRSRINEKIEPQQERIAQLELEMSRLNGEIKHHEDSLKIMRERKLKSKRERKNSNKQSTPKRNGKTWSCFNKKTAELTNVRLSSCRSRSKKSVWKDLKKAGEKCEANIDQKTELVGSKMKTREDIDTTIPASSNPSETHLLKPQKQMLLAFVDLTNGDENFER